VSCCSASCQLAPLLFTAEGTEKKKTLDKKIKVRKKTPGILTVRKGACARSFLEAG
jgi:hypothetical protein